MPLNLSMSNSVYEAEEVRVISIYDEQLHVTNAHIIT